MATSTLQTNEVNDLFLVDGRNLFIISGVEACEQDVRSKTLMRTTEDIYNVKSGVDYFGTIFTPQQDYGNGRKSLSDAILSCPDVISVDELQINVEGNTFNYDASIMTAYGPLKVSNSS